MALPKASAAVRAIAEKLEPKVAKAFLAAVEKLRGRISVAALAAAAERGGLTPQITGAIEAWPADLRAAVAVVNDVFLKAGAAAATGLRIATAFDLTNPFAIEAAQTRTALLVTRVSNETKVAIQNVIRRAYVEGIPPREAARLIRPLIGVNAVQAQDVLNLRRDMLEAGLRGRRLEEVIARRVRKHLKARALTIARTETIRAAADGQLSLWQQLRADRLLPATALKRWSATADAGLGKKRRTCPRCQGLNGVEVPLDEPFPGGGMGPPLHPNCRCSLVLARSSIEAPRRRA